MCDNRSMKGKEFIARARKYAKDNGLSIRVDRRHGKGSHVRLYLGNCRTTVQQNDIPKGTLSAMFRQLGIKKEDF